MSYFEHESAARRYAHGRPYFHPLVAGLIKDRLGLRQPVGRALDVACGTGQSTLALSELARRTVGGELSAGMLAHAPRGEGICYVQARAEELPFERAAFDLLTVALAFHWFERARFLDEAHRLLRPGGWLVVYNQWFTGEMAENPGFLRWMSDSYLVRYPTPARDNRPLSEAEAAAHRFGFEGPALFSHELSLSAQELAGYLMTQSNVIAAVEQAGESPDSVLSWLLSSLRPQFPSARGTFRFEGTIDYLWKMDE